jgi:hypothetical protein
MTSPLIHGLDSAGNMVPLKADTDGTLQVSIDALTAKIDELIALLPAALTTAGNLKVSIEEDNTAP